jgi:uncharacterized membrane protein
VRFSNAVTIDRPPADVFAFLSRFENLPLWNHAISDTRRLGVGPDGVGARYLQTRTVPRPGTEAFEVTRLEPNRAVAIRGALGPFDADSSYELLDEGDRTVLINTMELAPSGAVRVVASLAAPRIRAAVAANLARLKHLLEQGTP